MDFVSDRLLLWIVLLPLLGAVINGLFGRFADRRLVGALGVGSVALSFGLALLCFLRLAVLRAETDEPTNVRMVYDVYEWFSIAVGDLAVPIHVRFVFDALAAAMTLVVTGIGLLIHIYSTGYMHDDPSYARFFSYLNLFTASMLILVLASNLPLMFVGWEGVGLCSYLLIGFWWDNPAYAAAGRKAFVVNRIGDFGVLLGMFLLVAVTRSFEFSDINESSIRLVGNIEMGREVVEISVATAACLLLFLGCAGKSAQIPLYVWLPDAMAGPTPVSALIHAATMVTAGVYLCCRLSDVFARAPTAMAIIAVVGTLTALLAASIALFQNQMKRILAYSTVSQLGFMFAAVGTGAFAAGFYHVFTHAFFKACLFLGAGSVMHAVHAHGDADIRQLGGLRKYLKTTHWTFAVACLAIAGIPPLSGFFSKDDILLGAFTAEFPAWLKWPVFGLLALTALMTAFYMFRLYFRTFWGEYRGGPLHYVEPKEPEPPPVLAEGETAPAEAAPAPEPEPRPEFPAPHESPPNITIPLVILAGGAALAGILGIPHWIGHGEYTIWTRWLGPSIHLAHVEVGTTQGLAVMAVGFLAGVTGIWLAYSAYVAEDGVFEKNFARSAPGLYRLMMDKWRVDELYDAIIVRPVHFLATVSSNIDKVFVDGLLTRVTAVVVQVGGYLLTRLQTGVVYVYAGMMVVGLALLGWWFLIPHPLLQVTAQDRQVKAAVGHGLGYEYRWDYETDGEYDTQWSAGETSFDRAYDRESFRAGVLLVDAPRYRDEEIELERGDWEALDHEMFGADWAREGVEDPREPAVQWNHETGGVKVRPNGAAVRVGGSEITEETELAPGQVMQIGMAQIRVGGVVRITVEVRNAFGAVARDAEDVSVVPGRPARRAAVDVGGIR